MNPRNKANIWTVLFAIGCLLSTQVMVLLAITITSYLLSPTAVAVSVIMALIGITIVLISFKKIRQYERWRGKYRFEGPVLQCAYCHHPARLAGGEKPYCTRCYVFLDTEEYSVTEKRFRYSEPEIFVTRQAGKHTYEHHG